MDNTDLKKPHGDALPAAARGPLSAEMHNDRTHDSTVDTDGKNREAARIAGHGAISPDEMTCSNASLDDSVPDMLGEIAGFDSRVGGNHLLLALEPGCTLIDKGMTAPEKPYDLDYQFDDPRAAGDRQHRGRIHYALNHLRPARVIELQRGK
ncbi:DUF3005 domain-containing protein [Paraburkholderia saeva]|uniref:DUF3005 domain-containing protein n=1 Tax=Paraburkholderia saeva TaxID=2777537 RepID=A0A9N8RZD0_9BURK|nr:DUF3005 domain-containing protein [Paraburkholderia saeva]CAG4898203.1 hypothetical protein R52603_02424 [Paraburkholderia saeva]CAG4911829.1 hypothetical protein LMG31841_04106 [Paraburkholderia saeva]